MSQGCVQILSDLLGESSMVMMALEGIERVLSVGDLRVVRNAIASHSHDDQVCTRMRASLSLLFLTLYFSSIVAGLSGVYVWYACLLLSVATFGWPEEDASVGSD